MSKPTNIVALHTLLSDGEWHTQRELCNVTTAYRETVRRMRSNGYEIESQEVAQNQWRYRLHNALSHPSANALRSGYGTRVNNNWSLVTRIANDLAGLTKLHKCFHVDELREFSGLSQSVINSFRNEAVSSFVSDETLNEYYEFAFNRAERCVKHEQSLQRLTHVTVVLTVLGRLRDERHNVRNIDH